MITKERLIERSELRLEPLISLLVSAVILIVTYMMRESIIKMFAPVTLALLVETIVLTLLSTRLNKLFKTKTALILTTILLIGLMLAMVNVTAHTQKPQTDQPYTPIYDREELVRALRRCRIALHGYIHVDPVTGTTDYEFENLGEAETRRRVVEGIQIMEKANLVPSLYLAPGEFSTPFLVRIIEEETELTLLEEGGEGHGTEYTWLWRDGVSQEDYGQTLRRMQEEKTPLITIHIKDWNEQTASLFEDYLQSGGTPLVRIDDIDVNTDIEVVEEIKAMFGDSAIFAVIPLAVREASKILGVISEINFILFLLVFEAPLVFFTTWYLLLRRRVKVA